MPTHTIDDLDLAGTVASLHAKLNGGNTSPDLLRGVLTTLEELTNAVTNLLERDKRITKAVRAVHRDNQLLARATQQGLTGVKKALGTTGIPLQKVRGVTTTPALDPRLNGELIKSMGRQLVQWFGPRGGRVAPYNREMAAAWLMKGVLTPAEQRRWKKFNRLPDHVRLAS